LSRAFDGIIRGILFKMYEVGHDDHIFPAWPSENCCDLGIYGDGCEQMIALRIQRNALEQMLKVANAIPTLLEDFDLVEPTSPQSTTSRKVHFEAVRENYGLIVTTLC
jgi:hypothetical protein